MLHKDCIPSFLKDLSISHPNTPRLGLINSNHEATPLLNNANHIASAPVKPFLRAFSYVGHDCNIIELVINQHDTPTTGARIFANLSNQTILTACHHIFGANHSRLTFRLSSNNGWLNDLG